jgi:hypothetical protein
VSLLNTYTSYQLIAKDINKSIDRIEKQPMVDRDTQYYLANITKVKSIDDFVNNDRLFKYAMKAYGLEDMDYAKAFMVKALKEGVSDPDSFANKLTDKRYAQFVSAFNFASDGADATIYNPAQQLVTKNYATQAQIAGLDPNSDYVKGETTYYLANIAKVKSVDDLMSNDRLYTYALAAYGLDSATEDKDLIRQVLQGGVRDPNSVANKQNNTAKTPPPMFPRSSRRSTNICARRWRRTPARPMRACALHSISNARPPTSPVGTTCWPTPLWPAWSAPRLACPIPSPRPISTSRRSFSGRSSTSRTSPTPTSSASS